MSTIQGLKQQIKDLQATVTRIQGECSHPTDCVTRVTNRGIGSYCKSDDSYWYTFDCSLCEKHWRENQ